MKHVASLVLFFLLFSHCKQENKVKKQASSDAQPTKIETQLIEVSQSKTPIVIDGKADDLAWSEATWHPIDQVWLGKPVDTSDFSGRYKLSWSKDALYVLAEIKDDVLIDKIADPLVRWWDDDCLEIFVDADNSGGDHQYNHNAFAYHIALDGNVVDMSTEQKGKLYNTHIISERKTNDDTSLWEVKMALYDDTFTDEGTHSPIELQAQQKIGFAIAYCDNDSSEERENFIGSISVPGADKNRGWIDANIFGTLLLKND